MLQLTSKANFSIAAINFRCNHRAVLALITLLDGANAQLFHVEHCGNRNWLYQIRFPDSRESAYGEWGPLRRAAGEKALEPLLDPTVVPEVRWAWEEVEGGELIVDGQSADSSSSPSTLNPPPSTSWSAAIPHEWGDASGSFHVIVREPRDFREDPLIHASAMVRGTPACFELVMPRRRVAESGVEILTVQGTALGGAGPGSVLREAGEFATTTAAFTISNAGPSQVALLPVAPKLPASLPFAGCYAVRLGTLPPEEIELLRAYVAQQIQQEA